jgi:manganese transport protein
MAGQIVMEGFIHFRITAWARRLITRGVAIVPALAVTYLFGAGQTGKLLILSQVVLSFQLPFAVVPLVWFTASRAKMGELVAPRWVSGLATIVAVAIIGLNAKLIWDFFAGTLA